MRNKIKRFADNAARENIIEPGKELYEQIKGCWNERYFEKDQPITVELACGKGDYTIGLARRFPDRNFIGVDIKGSRIWYGSTTAEEEQLRNVAFLRTQILLIENFFAENELSELWITFPDPRPRDKDIRRRLTHSRYLKMYQKILKDGGIFHLKTDDLPFFDFTMEMLQSFPIRNLTQTTDLYQSPLLEEHFGIQTTYEKRWLKEGKKINYLRCEMLKS
ncbi:tRNA (guanosine(46)-N7)-methyltransferase TrmB [Nafulsella turpanensis]|uniref:tRNA (guanosine(46)-N7)-methyltransferase TrmB n=1 Tax=Nafulsella turpanensis TaxID=1265690 RepID=UPI00034A630E|nr:tRNA (guanosine(46)-N7)-methyltransferase TrmB [Nafulsella turpanensis]